MLLIFNLRFCLYKFGIKVKFYVYKIFGLYWTKVRSCNEIKVVANVIVE